MQSSTKYYGHEDLSLCANLTRSPEMMWLHPTEQHTALHKTPRYCTGTRSRPMPTAPAQIQGSGRSRRLFFTPC